MMIVMGVMLVALYIAASVMLAPGNALASFFFYALVASGLLGLVAPKLSFGLFLVQCAYLDLLKRLMVFDGAVSYGDLFWVLGIAPVSVVGIAAGLMLRIAFGAIHASPGDLIRLMISAGFFVITAAIAYVGGAGIGGTMQTVANGASYTLMIFILPIFFRDTDAAARLWRMIFWIFTPVAIYGIFQQIYGFQPFELEYLRSGLSIEIKQLEGNRVRAFSTLNSPTSLSVIAATLAAMGLSMGVRNLHPNSRVGINPIAGLFLFALFLGAWAASTVRVGILLVPIALIGALVFQRRGFTTLFYGMLGVSFVTLVAASNWMLGRVENWTRFLIETFGQNRFFEEMLNLNSYRDRLLGFTNVLGNPDAYTLFGMGESAVEGGDFYNHDPISAGLLRFGIVPLIMTLIVAGTAAWRMHRSVFMIQNRDCLFLASTTLAVAIGSIFVSLVGGNLLMTYPVNAVLWIEFGIVIAMIQVDKRLRKEAAAKSSAASPETSTSPETGLPPPARIPSDRISALPSRLPGWQPVPKLRKSGRPHLQPPAS